MKWKYLLLTLMVSSTNIQAQESFTFKVERVDSFGVEVVWMTSSEDNVREIALQRLLSSEGEFVTLVQEVGDRQNYHLSAYRHLDNNAYSEMSYYRLRLVNDYYDTIYSPLKVIEGIKDFEILGMSPQKGN